MDYHRLYEFWVGEQGVPGSLLGDFLVCLATFLVGKYRVAPWIHRRHTEHLDQKERQHREIMDEHRKLRELHTEQHKQLVQLVQGGAAADPPTVGSVPPQ